MILGVVGCLSSACLIAALVARVAAAVSALRAVLAASFLLRCGDADSSVAAGSGLATSRAAPALLPLPGAWPAAAPPQSKGQLHLLTPAPVRLLLLRCAAVRSVISSRSYLPCWRCCCCRLPSPPRPSPSSPHSRGPPLRAALSAGCCRREAAACGAPAARPCRTRR